MSRIRTIKPEFFTSPTVGDLPLGARLLFIGIWTQADDDGRLVCSEPVLKGQLFPYDEEVSVHDVGAWLEMLCDARLIRQYLVEGKAYLHVCGFAEHQRINRPTPSRLPAPPSDQPFRVISGGFTEDSVSDQGVLTPGREGKGRERKTHSINARPASAPVPTPRARRQAPSVDGDFDAWWAEYPRKVGKPVAKKAYGKARQGGASAEALRLGLSQWNAYWKRKQTDTDKIPHPTTWLNQARWEGTGEQTSSAPQVRCATCRKDVAQGAGCAGGETEETQEFCDRWRWVNEVPRVQDGHGA